MSKASRIITKLGNDGLPLPCYLQLHLDKSQDKSKLISCNNKLLDLFSNILAQDPPQMPYKLTQWIEQNIGAASKFMYIKINSMMTQDLQGKVIPETEWSITDLAKKNVYFQSPVYLQEYVLGSCILNFVESPLYALAYAFFLQFLDCKMSINFTDEGEDKIRKYMQNIKELLPMIFETGTFREQKLKNIGLTRECYMRAPHGGENWKRWCLLPESVGTESEMNAINAGML